MKKIFLFMAMAMVATSLLAKPKKDTVEVVPFDRGIGISKSVFIPKGTVAFGASFSYSTYDVGNNYGDAGFRALFGLVNGLHGNLASGGVAPHISYFVVDNLSVGGRFDFKRSQFDIGGVNLSFQDANLFSLKDAHYLKDTYSGAIFARYYIPFGASRRFAMFAELAASGGYEEAQSYLINEHAEKNGTHQDIYNFEIGVIPGLCAFVTNNFALEVSVGLVGLNYQKVIQKTNQVEESMMESSGANYKLNLLNLSLGISIYLPTGSNSAKKVRAYKQSNS